MMQAYIACMKKEDARKFRNNTHTQLCFESRAFMYL
jgi:hypothetical protein